MPARSEFLRQCQSVLPPEQWPRLQPGALPARRLGRTPELCERLLGYILAGQKTGVFSQPEDFPGGQLPVPGDLALLTSFADEPRCLIRYDEVALLPFRDIGPEHVTIETPALRDVAAWRRFHRAYWEPVLAARGEAFDEAAPIVFQRFSVLYPPAT